MMGIFCYSVLMMYFIELSEKRKMSEICLLFWWWSVLFENVWFEVERKFTLDIENVLLRFLFYLALLKIWFQVKCREEPVTILQALVVVYILQLWKILLRVQNLV